MFLDNRQVQHAQDVTCLREKMGCVKWGGVWGVLGKEAGSRGEASALRRDAERLHGSPEPHRLPYCNGACDAGLVSGVQGWALLEQKAREAQTLPLCLLRELEMCNGGPCLLTRSPSFPSGVPRC